MPRKTHPVLQPAPALRIRRIALWGILLLALILRIVGLDAKSLWLDETMSVENCLVRHSSKLKPYAGMIRYLSDPAEGFDAHPPLYQSIIWLWLHLGRGDAFVRMPSVAFGMIAVWLTYLIGRRLYGGIGGMAAAFLMAVSSFHIYFSQEARLNALVVTLFLAQTYAMLRILACRGTRDSRWWLAYGALMVLGLYTYALSILYIAALGVAYLWLTHLRRTRWVPLIAAHAIAALLFLPWYPRMSTVANRVAERATILQDAAGRPDLPTYLSSVAAWACGPFDSRAPAAAMLALSVVLIVSAAGALALRRGKRPAKLIAALAVVPMAGYILLPMPHIQAYDPKHLVFLQPLLMLALAGAVGQGQGMRRRLTPLVYAMLAMAALNVYALSHYYRAQKENWRGLYTELAVRLAPGDGIMITPSYTLGAMEYHARSPADKAAIAWLARRGHSGAPDLTRLWLIECSNPVAFPDKTFAPRLEAGGWAQSDTRAYAGMLGYLRCTLFVPARTAPESR